LIFSITVGFSQRLRATPLVVGFSPTGEGLKSLPDCGPVFRQLKLTVIDPFVISDLLSAVG